MGAPSLKIPSANVVWRSRDQLAFVTRERDGDYYVWTYAPDMRKYGYTTGYAWSFANRYKTPAVRRAQSEAARLRSRVEAARDRSKASSRQGGALSDAQRRALEILRGGPLDATDAVFRALTRDEYLDLERRGLISIQRPTHGVRVVRLVRPGSTSRRDREDDWHVLDVRTGCICPVGSQRAAEERAYQGNRSAGETRLIPQRSGCTTGRAPEERPIVFAAHDPARRGRRATFVGARDAARDPATRNADLVAWYRKHGELNMPRGFREEKVEWIRRTNRENAIAVLRKMGYRG